MRRVTRFASGLLCCLLIACSTSSPPNWRSLESSRSANIEYRGALEYRDAVVNSTPENGLGGTGKPVFSHPENGLGGSGKHARNGLGGTGSPVNQQRSQPLENGLGGTGQKPKHTTIVGSVSAFGSIWVNDRHILLPDETRYFRDGEQSQRGDIRLGQVVAVLADEYGDDYQALEVHSVNNVTGPLTSIQRISSDKTELQILGQRIIVDTQTRILNQQTLLAPEQLQVDQWLVISGLRAPDQSIRASLIRTTEQRTALLAGPISALEGSYVLGDQTLTFPDSTPDLNQPISMQGELLDDQFIVNDWQPMPLSRLLELADEFWLEGFPMDDAEFYLEGFEVDLPDLLDDMEFDDSIHIGFDDEGEFWLDDFEHDKLDVEGLYELEYEGDYFPDTDYPEDY